MCSAAFSHRINSSDSLVCKGDKVKGPRSVSPLSLCDGTYWWDTLETPETLSRLTSKIWTGLVGGRGRAGALPSRDVDGFEVLGHLRQLDGIEAVVQECDRAKTSPMQIVRITRRPPRRLTWTTPQTSQDSSTPLTRRRCAKGSCSLHAVRGACGASCPGRWKGTRWGWCLVC